MATQYATIADFEALAVAPEALRNVPADVKNANLLAASGMFEGFARQQWVPPYSSIGQDVKQWVCDVANWRLFSWRGFSPSAKNDDVIRQRYEDALALGELIASGRYIPELIDARGAGGPGTGASTGSGVDGSESAGGPLVNSSTQRGFSSRGTGGFGGPFVSD